MNFPTLYSYEIPILFNGLAELGFEKNIIVEAPLMGNIRLFRLDVGDREARIDGLVPFSEYHEAYEERIKKCHPTLRDEFPVYDDRWMPFSRLAY